MEKKFTEGKSIANAISEKLNQRKDKRIRCPEIFEYLGTHDVLDIYLKGYWDGAKDASGITFDECANAVRELNEKFKEAGK